MTVTPLSRYQGDCAVKMTANGSTVVYKSGDPVRDGGFENPILFSLFSDDWFANVFLVGDQKLKSRFEKAHDNPINRTTLLDIQNAGKADLNWMLQRGYFSKIEVETTAERSNTVSSFFKLYLFDETFIKLEVTKNGQNWQFQMRLPAHERLSDAN